MIAIYARQSIDEKDSISIEGHLELCRHECSGCKPKAFQDKGYLRKNTDQPAFQMMAAVKRREIDKIIVYRLDRISRSITDFGRV